MWTNARASQEALQAISLEGPVTAVVNSSTASGDQQSFSLQPMLDAPAALTTSYANITLAGVALSQSACSTHFICRVMHILATIPCMITLPSKSWWPCCDAVEPLHLAYMPQANLRDTYYPNRTCYNSEQVRSLHACYHACQLALDA